jgi:hypothetical protein
MHGSDFTSRDRLTEMVHLVLQQAELLALDAQYQSGPDRILDRVDCIKGVLNQLENTMMHSP